MRLQSPWWVGRFGPKLCGTLPKWSSAFSPTWMLWSTTSTAVGAGSGARGRPWTMWTGASKVPRTGESPGRHRSQVCRPSCRCCRSHDKCYEESRKAPGCAGIGELPHIISYEFACSNQQVTCSGEDALCRVRACLNSCGCVITLLWQFIISLYGDPEGHRTTSDKSSSLIKTFLNWVFKAAESHKKTWNLPNPYSKTILFWLTCAFTAINDKCEAAVCECDRAAAHCFAQHPYNPEYKNLDSEVHCVN